MEIEEADQPEQKQVRRGFALEGGGARGSYHMGVCKAYIEEGYEFHGAVGTSIGAINAVMLASGDFEKAIEVWESISLDLLFDQEFLDMVKVNNKFPTSLTTALRKLISDRGIDHSKIREFLTTYIDEDKVRNSGMDFGLVTFSLSERKPYEVFLNDIPEGKLIDFLLASAKLPIFTPHHVDDNRFIDGAFYNNCPINMLIDQGYDEIIAIRTKGFGMFRKYNKKANVTLIETDENLGSFLDFNSDNAKLNIKRGYHDGLRAIRGLQGRTYYLTEVDVKPLVLDLFAVSDEFLDSLSYFKKETIEKRRAFFERAIPDLADYLKLGKNFTYEEFILAVIEDVAMRKEIERLEIYTFAELCKFVRNTPKPKPTNLLSRVGIDLITRKADLVEQIANLLI